MKRPYIICSMITTVDGKIAGDFWYNTEVGTKGLALYNERHFYKNPDAYMSGAVTARKLCGEHDLEFIEHVASQKREDHVAVSDAKNYYVVLDVRGTVPWAENVLEYAGRPAAHIIELLTEDVGDEYIDFLKRRKISYIFCGKTRTEASMSTAAKKLYTLFHIRILKCAGGAGLNWAFQREGLIDELCLFMVPLTDGNSNSPSVFERRELPEDGTFSFKLASVDIVDQDYLWIKYLKS